MNQPQSPAALELRDAVLLIVGVVIGAGIFKAPSIVASATGDTAWMFGAWLLGGAISLVGALCYAELATAYAHPGGEYTFLKRAFGRNVGFLFGWARFSVIITSSIALLAFVFGDYMQQVLPLKLGGVPGSAIWGVACVVVLWLVNDRGLKPGARAQNWMTIAEVSGLLLIVVAALWLVAGGVPPATAPAAAGAAGAAGGASAPGLAAFGLAMVFVLLTYGGWNEAGYISSELKGGSRNMVLTLVISILVITVLYMLVTWAYWRGLGIVGMAQSQAIAADLLAVAFGSVGATLISIMVAVAAITSINATMIVGARCHYAVSCDWPALNHGASWDVAGSTPRTAMRLQNAAALLLILLGAWAGAGFKAVVEFSAPVFWFFFLLTGLSLFVLRVREPQAPRPFRVPLYPVLPALFCASCAYMLWSSLAYVSSQKVAGINAAWIGVGVLLTGLVLLGVLSVLGKPGVPASAAERNR